ncbi:MAG: DUF2341 domain-containing protein, partial [Planctomycetes bacterium]|nr:DUF2341 domain-containing protein [Planctomycetota bacterium]
MRLLRRRLAMTVGWFICVYLCLSVVSGTAFAVDYTSAGGMAGWDNRSPIVITETSGALLTNYQVLIEIQGSNPANPNYIDFAKVLANGDDIRFTKSDGSTLLDYWIESWDDVGLTAKIWVEVDSLPASTATTIYVYYNNPAEPAASSVANTFIREIDGGQPVKGAWTLDDNAQDTSGNANHGTLNGGMGYTAGKFGSAGQFDGTNDYVSKTSGVSGIGGTNQFTVEAWVKRSSTGAYHTIWGMGDTSGWDSLLLRINPGNTISLYVYNGVDAGNSLTTTNTFTDTTSWHHIVGTYNAGTMAMYVDGVSWSGTTGGGLTGNIAAPTTNLGIGANYGG